MIPGSEITTEKNDAMKMQKMHIPHTPAMGETNHAGKDKTAALIVMIVMQVIAIVVESGPSKQRSTLLSA